MKQHIDTDLQEMDQKQSYKKQISFLVFSMLCFTAVQDFTYIIVGAESVTTSLYLGNYVGYLVVSTIFLLINLRKNTFCSLDMTFVKKLALNFLLPVAVVVLVCLKMNIPYGLAPVLNFMGGISAESTLELLFYSQLDRYLAMVQPTLNLFILAVLVVIPINVVYCKTHK